MMHKIKKATTSAKGSENAEFADYKGRLESLSSYLRTSSAALNLSEQAWKEVCNRQKVFADQFANKYPDKDEVRDFGKQSAAASQALVKEFVLKTDGSTAAHWEVDGVVQEYLAEIAEISGEYKAVAEAHKEVCMYSKKVDDLQKLKKPDETKIGRNIEKFEEAKKAYEDLLERIVDKMKAVYGKRQVALKATYVAYWSSQLRAFNLLDSSLEPTRAFIEASMKTICEVKIRNMTAEDVAAFVAQGASSTNGAAKEVPTSPVEGAPNAPAEPAATAI